MASYRTTGPMASPISRRLRTFATLCAASTSFLLVGAIAFGFIS
jgi:hypothetical protein